MTYKRKPTELPIADIRVGRRHRKDMGDIAELAASMAELGLLQAIGVRPNNELIWGERRLRAAQQLGWTTIPVKVMDLDAVARGADAKGEAGEPASKKGSTARSSRPPGRPAIGVPAAATGSGAPTASGGSSSTSGRFTESPHPRVAAAIAEW